MQDPLPLTRDLVLIGGGHAHALVLRMWAMKPIPGVQLTLINPGPTAPYSGMLPGHIAGHYSREVLDIDLVRLARLAGARLVLGEAVGLDPEARTVTVSGRGEIGYDVASLDIGIHTRMPQTPGFAEHGVPAKPLELYARRWRAFLEQVRAGHMPAQVAVIGGGIAGVELAVAMAHAVGPQARVTIIEKGPALGVGTPAMRAALTRELARQGIAVRTGETAQRITADAVELASGERIASAFTLTVAGAYAHPWLRQTTLPLTEGGFVRVGPDLAVEGTDALFAVGDCAHLTHAPRPKAGVYAVRAAPVLLANLRAAVAGGRRRNFRPQSDYLKLVSLGDKRAMAEKWGVAFSGRALWRWKNRIDQRFMDRFRDLPKMPAPPLPRPRALGVDEELGGKPLCGGCGAKVAPGALGQALGQLAQPARPDVLTGPGDDAAVIAVGGARLVATTDHLRGFIADHGLMARIAAVHALGDIWAMGASPQAALVSVILPRMSAPLQARAMTEILQAAASVLGAEGAEIAGGHSSMGHELTLGFALTGLAPEHPIGKSGARPGDALVLTRPIGSGTLFAAEMRGEARGEDIAHALDVLSRPQGDAARLLSGAHAMTDVTGFGLAGHLGEICEASGLSAEIVLDSVPVLPGAEDLAARGVRSSLHAANVAAQPVMGGTGPRAALLHDPQTAGGLLAAVDPAEAMAITQAIRQLGHEAAVIGTLVAGPPQITVV